MKGAPVEKAEIDNCGHIPWVECLKQFFAAVEGFLFRLPKDGDP